MNIYNFSKKNGEYLTTTIARQDPRVEGNFLVPAHAVTIEPPMTNDFEVAVFADGEWRVQEDHRNRQAWSIVDASQTDITAIGPLPENVTLENPQDHPHPVWVEGSWQSSQALLLEALLDQVDTKTNEIIEMGWVYPDANGQQVRLNGVDQANYEGEKNLYAELDYDGVDVTSYFPLDVKVWTGPSGEPIMLSMADLAAYKTFIRAGKTHIRAKLQEGWLLKGTLIAMDIEGLKAWVDPR